MSAASTGTFNDSSNRAAMMDWSERKSIVENEIDELIEDILYHISSTRRTDPNVLKLSVAFKEQLYTEHAEHTAAIAESYRTCCYLSSDRQISQAYYRDGSLKYNIVSVFKLESEDPSVTEPIIHTINQTLSFPCSEMELKNWGGGSWSQAIKGDGLESQDSITNKRCLPKIPTPLTVPTTQRYFVDWTERKSVLENEIEVLLDTILDDVAERHRGDPNFSNLLNAFETQLKLKHMRETASIAEIYRTRTLLGSGSKISSAYYRDGRLRYNVGCTYILKSEYAATTESVEYPVDQILEFPCSKMDFKQLGGGTIKKVLHHEEPILLVPFVAAERRDPLEVYGDSLSKRKL